VSTAKKDTIKKEPWHPHTFDVKARRRVRTYTFISLVKFERKGRMLRLLHCIVVDRKEQIERRGERLSDFDLVVVPGTRTKTSSYPDLETALRRVLLKEHVEPNVRLVEKYLHCIRDAFGMSQGFTTSSWDVEDCARAHGCAR